MSNINFEEDKQTMLGKTDNIQSLADQVEKLDQLQKEIEASEEILKDKKTLNISPKWSKQDKGYESKI